MKPFAHESPLTCGENDATYSLIVPHLDLEKLKWKLCKETDNGKKKYSFAAISHNFMGHKKCSSIFSFSSILSQFHRERRSFPWPLVYYISIHFLNIEWQKLEAADNTVRLSFFERFYDRRPFFHVDRVPNIKSIKGPEIKIALKKKFLLYQRLDNARQTRGSMIQIKDSNQTFLCKNADFNGSQDISYF